MASFELLYNPTDGATGGNIVATVQKCGSALGDVWDFTNSAWGSFGAIAYADRTLTITEANPIGQAIGYYRVFDLDTDYTGKVCVGYFDGNFVDTKHPLFSEVRYVRKGVELTFSLALDRVNRDVGKAFTFLLSRRSDGTYVATNDIQISTSDDIDFAFETAVGGSGTDLFPANTVVSSINSVTVSPASQMSVSVLGPNDSRALLSVDGGQLSGTTYTVTCVALMSTGEQIICKGEIVCG